MSPGCQGGCCRPARSLVCDAQRELERRLFLPTIVLFAVMTAVLGALSAIAARHAQIRLPHLGALLIGASLAVVIELVTRRRDASALNAVRATFGELAALMGEAGRPVVRWRRGLPTLSGALEGVPFIAWVESAGKAGLRLAVSLVSERPVGFFAYAVGLAEAPTAEALRLKKAGLVALKTAESLELLAGEPIPACLEDAGFLGRLNELVCLNTPYSACLDQDDTSIAWDSIISPTLSASQLVTLIAGLKALDELAQKPEVPQEEDQVTPQA